MSAWPYAFPYTKGTGHSLLLGSRGGIVPFRHGGFRHRRYTILSNILACKVLAGPMHKHVESTSVSKRDTEDVRSRAHSPSLENVGW